MGDLKRKLAEKIARDLFTSGERRYSHLSLNDAEELGWCEKVVADRIEEHLLAAMDELEDPEPAEKPTWKPGDWFKCGTTFCRGGQVAKIDDDYIVDQEGEYHLLTDAFHVPAPKPHEFKVGDWAQHDNHAPFKVRSTYPKGDDRYTYGEDGQAWLASSLRHVPAPKEPKPDQGPQVLTNSNSAFQAPRPFLCSKHGCHMVLVVYDRPGGPTGNCWSCPECAKEREPKPTEATPESENDIFVPMQPKSERNVTMKVPRPDPFQGPQWGADAISQASVDGNSWSAYLRDCDLYEELRRVKEGK